MSDEGAVDAVEHVSAMPFEVTLESLSRAIAWSGLILFGQIDHQGVRAERVSRRGSR